MDPSDTFPFKMLRVPGGIQAVLGGLSAVSGGVILALHLVRPHATSMNLYGIVLPIIPVLTAPIYCGLVFLITGLVGACVTRPKCLRVSFLILSLLGAIIFAPAQLLACAAFVLVYLNSLLAFNDAYIIATWILFALAGIFAFVQLIVAIVSACICCCCIKSEPRGQAYAMVPSTA